MINFAAPRLTVLVGNYGSGKTELALNLALASAEKMTTTLVDLVIRVSTAYLLSERIGSSAVYWSVAIGWLVGAVMGVYFFASGKWKKVKLLKKQ